MRLLAWTLVWIITVIDCWFAYALRTTFCEWEMNPVAVVVCKVFGIWGVILFRFLLLGAVTALFWMAVRSKRCRPIFAHSLLFVWFIGHLALLGYYFAHMEDMVWIAETFYDSSPG